MEVRRGHNVTPVGIVPEGWRASTLGSEADLLAGCPFPSEGFVAAGVRLLRGSNVKRGVIEWGDDITEHWPSVTQDIQKYRLQAGDLVIAMDGALVGRSFAVLTQGDLPALLVQRVARVRSRSADLRLLGGWIASQKFVQHVDSVKTHTAIPHISPRDIREFALALPSESNEQRAIAEALSDTGALVDGLAQLIAKKRDLKKAAMQQLLTGQSRLRGFQGDWEEKTIASVAPLQRGFDLPARELTQGPYPVVYSNGVETFHNRFMVKGPGVVTGRSGTLGRVHYVETDFWPHNTALWVTQFNGNVPKFVYYLYDSLRFERFASGSGVPTLNRNDAHTYRLIIPCDRNEQRAIAAVLSDMDFEIAALEARRDKTRDLKQGMMQELLTGRTRLV